MKEEITQIDGTPEKRMFWSIISDYGLLTALCELVDNAIDIWVLGGRETQLQIDISLDFDRQIISVKDYAGGVSREDLRLLIVPGGSGNDPIDEVIGVFGVGSKRAAVALGESIRIQSRKGDGNSYQIDITKEWIESEEWEIPLYQVDELDAGSTEIHISEVRRVFTEDQVLDVATELGQIYANFITNRCTITVNGETVAPKSFANWAYPDRYPPKQASLSPKMEGIENEVSVKIAGGLILDRDPEMENYGVYFYCNDRLIMKEVRHREVGYYITQEAGVPHPDASLARVVVEMNGPARAMPWNSNKTEINFDHPIFQQLRPTIVSQMGFYSKLSRRLKNEWQSAVFSKTDGQVVDVPPEDLGASRKVIQPELPKIRKKRVESLISQNRAKIDSEPWTLGLIESLGAVDVLQGRSLIPKTVWR